MEFVYGEPTFVKVRNAALPASFAKPFALLRQLLSKQNLVKMAVAVLHVMTLI
jgi:hypothetical protein